MTLATAIYTSAQPAPTFASYAALLIAYAIAGLLLYGMIPQTFGPAAASPWHGRRRVKLVLSALLAGPVVLAIAGRDGRPRLGLWSAEFDFFFRRIWAPVPVGGYAGDFVPYHMLAFSAAVTIASVVAVKLWEKWVNGRLEEDEQQTGLAGVAAWISGNQTWLIGWLMAITIAYFPALQRDLNVGIFRPIFGGAIVAFAVLAAYPIRQTLREMNEADVRDEREPSYAPPPPTDPHDAQQRVLRLLEEGRINAEDAAELISALSASASPSTIAPRPVMPLARKLVIAGAAIVLFAFFLPWFTVRPAEFADRVLGITTPRFNGQSVALGSTSSIELSIRGGDVGNGLGWVILAGTLLAAAAPAFAEQLRPGSRRLLARASAGVASLLALYLLGGGLNYASPGMFLVIVGLAVQWAGLASELSRRPRPALAPPIAVASA